MEESASYSATTPDYGILNRTTYDHLFPTAPPERQTSSLASFYPVLILEMFLSIVCLILSIIIFTKLPEFRNIHGKNLITMSFCILTAYIFLCLDLAVRHHVSYSFCYTIAVVIHVSFLGFFFWTSVLAFDMWSNITRIRRETFVENEGYWKRYIKYSIFAWSGTLLAALPAFIFESVDIISPHFRPDFGRKRCWLSGINAFTFYFNTPVGIIVLVNSFLYISTMRRVYAIDQLVAYLQAQQQQKRLDLYVRLFFLMGLVWFVEFLPWMTNKHWLYALAGMLMALYGVFFCAIFVLNKRIIRQIKEHFFGIVTEEKNSIPVRIPSPIYPINSEHPLANEVFTPRTNIFGEHRF